MAENKKFFCTVANDDDGVSDGDEDGALIQTFTGGPAFVKSTATTLFQDEEDIKKSKQLRIKVSFAKPKVKPGAAAAVSDKASSENFTKRNSRESRDKK